MPRSPRRTGALALTVATLLAGGAAFPAVSSGTPWGAPVNPTTTTTRPATVPTTGPPSVPLAAADAAQAQQITARLRAAEVALAVAKRQLQAAQRAADTAAGAEARASAALAVVAASERAAIDAVMRTQAALRILAVKSYVSGGPVDPLNALLRARSVDEFSRRQELVGSVVAVDVRALDAYNAARRQASQAALRALAGLQHAQAVRHAADDEVAAGAARVAVRSREVTDTAQLLRLVTAAINEPGTDIPRLVLDAYQRAAARVQQQGCKLSWAALAGIGRVESDHGRDQGAALTLSGDLVPPIVGPALTGQDGTQLVPDSDNGRWDGDVLFAHAIGPMQMIESTWAVVGRDGNGDGIADPNNIYDAALSAAVYLCRAVPGGGLDTDDGLRQAFFSYNHADWYVEEVLTLTHLYAAASLPS